MSFAFAPVLDRPSPARGLFSDADYRVMRQFFAARPELLPTPTRQLDTLGSTLNIGGLNAKVESERFGLNAFKLLGARFAIEQLLADGTIQPGSVQCLVILGPTVIHVRKNCCRSKFIIIFTVIRAFNICKSGHMV